VWCTHSTSQAESIYRELKKAGVLVRYMLYAGWGDGLRITVGTDEQVDACLAQLKSLV
jgi:histidinol-phosphate aminotransferase